jgi:hypothetical protein
LQSPVLMSPTTRVTALGVLLLACLAAASPLLQSPNVTGPDLVAESRSAIKPAKE